MRDIIVEASRKRGSYFKAFTIVVVLFVLSTQIFVVWNVQQKYKNSTKNAAAKTAPHRHVARAKKVSLLAHIGKPR